MFKKVVRLHLLLLLMLAACSPKEEEPEVPPEEPTACPYKLPWPSFLPAILVTQSISDPTNKSHLPKSLEEFAIDFFMPEGTPLIASRAGTLRGMNNKGTRGGDDRSLISETNFVFIDHGDGTAAFYGHLKHLDEPIFTQADINNKYVEQGELIGYSGSTGWSTSPHLHFQVQNDTEGYGQSIPFCFSDVPGGVPLLYQKYVSGNVMSGVLGAQVESYTENFNVGLKALSEKISFFAVDQALQEGSFVVQNLLTGETEVTSLTEGDPFNPLATYHQWSPDGKTLIGSFGYAIYTKNYASGEVTLLLEPKGEPQFVPDYWAPVMDWVEASFDKGLIIDCLAVDYSGNPPSVYSGICWFSFADNEVSGFWQAPEDAYLTQSEVDYFYPSSSASANRIAFLRQYFEAGEAKGSTQLVVYNTDENMFIQLGTGSVRPLFPKVSEDGKTILFLGEMQEDSQSVGIWIIDSDGSNLRQIIAFPRSPGLGSIDWSQDGERVIYSKNSDLWIFDFATGKEIQITYTPATLEVQPAFVPNQ